MFNEMLQYPQRPLVMERRWKSNGGEVAPNCPRCASPNTKFCYYNNYSLSQPRYFCKGCRRYWTKGGSLRNVPVGGGCRKTRRSKSSRSSSSSHSAPNFSRNPPSPSPCGGDPSPEIDLAAVFANFLNRSSGSETNDNSSGASSLEINNMIDCENPCDLIDEARFGEVLPRIEDDGQEFMGSEINGFELQGMIGDELPVPESLPDFGWQTQEFGSFLPDDQLKISNNLIGENWGSFDILGYELFSRP